jgi:glyoxylase-like metal-dependent hydrolase (beta-lactamase superfamily II)
MKQIIPGVYTITGLMGGRVYLIEDTNGLTLIDTSLPNAASKIIQQIEGMGRKMSDVKRILITHAHPDHIGSLPELKQVSGAEVMVSAIDRPVTEGKEFIPRPAKETLSPLSRLMVAPEALAKGTSVDREIGEGDILPEVLGGLQVIFTPGHSPGHVSFWQPEKRILFCGDVMMRLPWGMSLPITTYTYDMAENKRSIQKLARLNPEVVCFGHGVPLTQNASETVQKLAAKYAVPV